MLESFFIKLQVWRINSHPCTRFSVDEQYKQQNKQ